MLNDLILLSGVDIPLKEAALVIHQPRIKEIALIGENNFFTGYELLKFSKDSLTSEDKARLGNQTDFDIIMSIINDKQTPEFQKNTVCTLMLLTILFPEYEIQLNKKDITFIKRQDEQEVFKTCLNNANYESFKQILEQIVPLGKSSNESYNPSGDLARKIADKLKQGNQKRAEMQKANQKTSIFSRYISILTVGEQKDMNSFMDYTPYQLFDEYERYILKTNYDTVFKLRIAGAKDVKDADDWMKDIHEE